MTQTPDETRPEGLAALASHVAYNPPAGPAMSTWLRLTLITMTVGGGFTGAALTLQLLLSPQVIGLALVAVCVALVLLNVFVLISGLLFVQNPLRITPLVVALAAQVPVISSPIVAFHFGAGLYGSVALTEAGPFCLVRLGSEWQVNFLQSLPWGLGINLVAALLLVALHRSTLRRQQRQ